MAEAETFEHPADIDLERLFRECDVRRTRRSGPGGQRRNKVETAVVLKHRPTGIETQSSKRRSQAENRRVALQQLRLRLALGVRTVRPDRAVPSPRWSARCRRGRIAVSPEHSDFPSLLAESLDLVAQLDGDVKGAAERLGCTQTQLVRLIGREPEALGLVNDARRARGLGRLR